MTRAIIALLAIGMAGCSKPNPTTGDTVITTGSSSAVVCLIDTNRRAWVTCDGKKYEIPSNGICTCDPQILQPEAIQPAQPIPPRASPHHHWKATRNDGDGWGEFNDLGIYTGAIDPNFSSCSVYDFEGSGRESFETCAQAKRWIERRRGVK